MQYIYWPVESKGTLMIKVRWISIYCDKLHFFFSLQHNARVAVLGASGGIGQPLSLLLKNSPLVSELSLYDIAHTPGVAADLSHIETRATVTGTEMVNF